MIATTFTEMLRQAGDQEVVSLNGFLIIFLLILFFGRS